MKMNSLLMTQRILLINWIIAPALGIWIWVKGGFLRAALFIIIWLIVDKVWDWLTEVLMANVSRIGANEEEAVEIETTGEVPTRLGSMMIVDLLGTLVLPWIIAGLFLAFI